jgi:hypothetical protein
MWRCAGASSDEAAHLLVSNMHVSAHMRWATFMLEIRGQHGLSLGRVGTEAPIPLSVLILVDEESGVDEGIKPQPFNCFFESFRSQRDDFEANSR